MKLSLAKKLSYALGIVMSAVLIIALVVGLSCEVKAQSRHKAKGKTSTVQKTEQSCSGVVVGGIGLTSSLTIAEPRVSNVPYITLGSQAPVTTTLLYSGSVTDAGTVTFVSGSSDHVECTAENLKLALAKAADMLTDPNITPSTWSSLTPGVLVCEWDSLPPADRKRLEAEATAKRLRQEADEIEARSRTVRWVKAVQQSCRAKPVAF